MSESFRDLLVWQRAIQMSLAIYRFTTGFPKEELFGLTGQIRRAGVSVASNIAEGYGRNSTGEYKHFLGMARGSNSEVETQLVIAKELGYGNPQALKEAEDLCTEVGKMLRAILSKLEGKNSQPASP
jgi:four helix bundle protein